MKTFKKALAVVMCVIMALTAAPLTGFIGFGAEGDDIPEGYTPIYDIEDLYAVRNNLSGNYILMADIDMTEYTASGGDWDVNGTGWLPIGTDSDNAFTGIFDGNDYSIIGMRINGNPCDRIGLFGVISGGEVKDLKIVNANITTSAERAGTLSGSFANGKIENIAVINTSVHKTGNAYYSGSYVSGLTGTCGSGTISKCFVSGTVTGMPTSDSRNYNRVSGISGCLSGAIIQNCYNLSNITLGRDRGGIATMYTDSATIENCINVGTVAGYPLVDDGVYGPTSGQDAHYDYDNYTLIGNYYLVGSGTGSKGTEAKTDSQSTVLGVTAAQLKSEVALANLDFENTWFIDTATGIEHPQLQSNPEVDAESITIKTLPKQQFLHHDEFDCSGLTVTVEYENGTTSEREIKAKDVSGYDMDAVGTQTVTVKFLSAETTYDIVVNERPVDSIELSEQDVVMDINTTKALSVTYTPTTATNQTVEWTSDDESVATVDENGVITAVGKGSAIITATTANGISQSCYVEVLVPAKTVTLSDTLVKIQPNETHKLTAILDPANTTDTLSWSSSDENVATVDENGVVTAVATGNATIVATTSRSKFASCNIQVRIFSTSVTVNPTAQVNVGKTVTLTATMQPADTTDTITWKSSDTSVATVSSSGVVTAKKVGTVTITATTTSGKTATCVVTVLKPSTSVKLDKTEITLNKGAQEALVATVLPVDSTDNVTWKSSNENVATVINGVVTATGKGKAVITAKTDSGYTATCTVNVFVPSTTVQLDKALATVVEGATLQLNVTVGPEDSTDTVTWESSASDIASVSASGVVSALANGEAVITVTTTSGKTAECKVTVTHDIVDTVTPPTCTEGGYTTHECAFCDYSYIDSETQSTGHDLYDVEAKAPTCVEAGWEAYQQCKNCDYNTCVEISANNHSFGDWVIANPATCTEDGLQYRVCDACSIIEHDVLTSVGHSWNEEYTIDKAATCTEDGAKSIHCSACDETKDSEVIPSTGHTEEIDAAVEATCTSTGLTEGSHCSVCGETLVVQEIVEKAEHSFGDWVTVKTPTCTDKGFDYRACENCEAKETKNIDENGHAWETEYTVDKAATCTEDGSKSIHCVNCDATKDSTVVPATGHTEVTDDAVAATCTSTGLTEGSHCLVCGETLVAQQIVDKTEHTYGEWVTVKTATCTDTGFEYQVCNDCGFTATKSIDENGHDWETEYTVDKAATCTTDGSKSIHCADCDATKDSEVIPAANHNYGEWIVAIEAECEKKGLQYKVCETCEFTKLEEVAKLNHDWEAEFTVDVPATCTAEGSKSHHCTRCEAKNDVTVVPATGHDFVESSRTDATCTADGTIYYTCANDSEHTKTEKIPAKGHTAGDWEIDTPTSYLADGKKVKKCTVCKTVLEEKAIAKLVAPKVNIKKPSTTTVDYDFTLILHAEVDKPLPEGWSIKWTVNNGNFKLERGETQMTCGVTSVANGSTTVTATVYDENGNEMSKDEQTLNSNASFGAKISAFFKKLFGISRIILQSI